MLSTTSFIDMVPEPVQPGGGSKTGMILSEGLKVEEAGVVGLTLSLPLPTKTTGLDDDDSLASLSKAAALRGWELTR